MLLGYFADQATELPSGPGRTSARPQFQVLCAAFVLSPSRDAKFFDRKFEVARQDSHPIEAFLSLKFNKAETCDSFATQTSMTLLQRTGDFS
jgi:hypothetical protein